MADTTTTTSLPARRASTMRCATRLIFSASPTEEPPYFCTTSAITGPLPSLCSYALGEPSVYGTRSPWKTLRVLRPVVPLISVGLALAACSGSSAPPKASVTPPADALAGLAAHGSSAVYTATYTFRQVSPDTTATVKVWRADPSLRVDVVAGPTTATLLMTTAGSYSCSITGAKRSCLLVAKAGAPLPAPFDVAPANLFSADLHTLAADTAAYDVRAAPARP